RTAVVGISSPPGAGVGQPRGCVSRLDGRVGDEYLRGRMETQVAVEDVGRWGRRGDVSLEGVESWRAVAAGGLHGPLQHRGRARSGSTTAPRDRMCDWCPAPAASKTRQPVARV